MKMPQADQKGPAYKRDNTYMADTQSGNIFDDP
jgi:hypothetical protein